MSVGFALVRGNREVWQTWVGLLHGLPRMRSFLAASLLTELSARVRTSRKFCNAEEGVVELPMLGDEVGDFVKCLAASK